MKIGDISELVGDTPLLRVRRLYRGPNTLLGKLEGDNPGGSVKDRAALCMIRGAEERGELAPGDTVVEPTSGNTGIALAMIAAARGYRMKLVMPANMSVERRATMKAFGAEVILVSAEEGMEGARDLADKMAQAGEGLLLNQFANPDNPRAHYETTAPEIWRATEGRLTHFVSSMGTTGTIVGCARYFKEQNPAVQIVGVQPEEGSQIPGIRRWTPEYVPKIYDDSNVDRILSVSRAQAENTMRALAKEEGLFSGISSGGCMFSALQVAEEARDAVIVSIVCDRGDRYISAGVFPA